MPPDAPLETFDQACAYLATRGQSVRSAEGALFQYEYVRGALVVALLLRELRTETGAPWVVIAVGLTALALWILAQPMDMRGTGFLS